MCAPFIEWAIQRSLWQNTGSNQLKRKQGFFWLMVLEDTTSSHDSWEAKKGTGKAKASIYPFRQIPPFKNVFPVSQLLTATSLFSKFHDLWIASQTSTSLYLIHRPLGWALQIQSTTVSSVWGWDTRETALRRWLFGAMGDVHAWVWGAPVSSSTCSLRRGTS